jgi:hypothetical protein
MRVGRLDVIGDKMKTLTRNQIWIIISVLAAAALHFGAATDKMMFPDSPDPLFTLNGLGYLGLLGAYFLPIPFFQHRHKLVWWALFIYASITIMLWFVISVVIGYIGNAAPFLTHDTAYGMTATTIEVILLFLLWKEKP